MLYPRVIPCLLVHKGGLYKTVKFKDPKYVGDPINAVKIFNEKEADELIILDIDASVKKREPNYSLIEKVAKASRMPLCYGGGIKTPDQAEKIFKLGIEKIAISSEAIINPNIIKDIGNRVGTQSVVVVIDVKKTFFGKYEIYIYNGEKKIKRDLIKFIKEIQDIGVGEIAVNSIDRDGTMKGYDFKLIDLIKPYINVPFTILGGASSLENIGEAINRYGIIGAAAGSLFVFKGKYRAVLINYPSKEEKENLIKKYLKGELLEK